MADLEKSDVTFHKSYYTTQDKLVMSRDVTIELAGQGDETDTIPASALGFKSFEGSSTLTEDDDSTIVLGVASFDKSILLLQDGTHNAPGTFTGTFRGVVNGRAH